MERVYYIDNQLDCYLRIYSKNNILGSVSYYAERHSDGKLCCKYQIDKKNITVFLSFYDNIFRIANRQKWNFHKDIDNINRLKTFIESKIYRKMWDYFLGGMHVKFGENVDGFSLTANHNQFILVANKELCRFRIVGNIKFKSIDPEFYNFHDCDVTFTRDEGELFLSALAYKLQLELSTVPMLEIKSTTYISSDNYHLVGLTLNIHKWYKTISYQALTF